MPAAADNREMLKAILAAELQAGKDYTQRAQEAEAYGDKGLVPAWGKVVDRPGDQFFACTAFSSNKNCCIAL